MFVEMTLLEIILILLLIALFLALAYFVYKATETAQQKKWFSPSSPQSKTLYNGSKGGDFIAPFAIEHQPMERLALFNFENQPDSVYRSFEIQYFDDELHGKGYLVIGYRNDNKVDVYIQTGLIITSNYDETAAGLAENLERSMSTTKFEVTDQFAAIDFNFEDKIGRPIKVHLLEEYRTKKRKPFGILAPLGSSAQNPPAFPLYLMYDFSLVRQAKTELSIEVDGKKLIPDNLPIPFDWESAYVVRYSTNPVILNLNKNFSGALDVFHPQDQSAFSARGIIYTLISHDGHLEISSLRADKIKKDIRIDFYPPFPELSCMADGQQVKGNFTAWLGASMGQIDGTYHISRNGNLEQIQIRPDGGWRSGSYNPWLHILFTFNPTFENWPKKYCWSANIDLTNPNAPQIQSQWDKTQ